jgi:hypothetical protein
MTLAAVYSQGTQAAAEFVTDANYLGQLNQRLDELKKEGKSPRSFQTLLKVGVEKGIPTTITILALHDLHSSQH